MSVFLAALLVTHALAYRDINVAAHEALYQAAKCSQNKRECGGVIFQTPTGFVIGDLERGAAYGMTMHDYTRPPPAGWKIVADYHVHICSSGNYLFANFFSPADAYLNQGFHTVGYMYSFCDGNIHRYDPAQDERDDEEVDFKPHKNGTKHAPIYLTIGHITGWINPAGLVKHEYHGPAAS